MGTGTAGRNQQQFMALVREDTMTRMDVLRVATGKSRAEINRIALDGTSLREQEMAAGGNIEQLEDVANKLGMSTEDFVSALVLGRKAGVPKLEELEAMSIAKLREQIAPR